MLLTKSAWKTQDKMVTIREKYHHWTLEERKENADRLREEVDDDIMPYVDFDD